MTNAIGHSRCWRRCTAPSQGDCCRRLHDELRPQYLFPSADESATVQERFATSTARLEQISAVFQQVRRQLLICSAFSPLKVLSAVSVLEGAGLRQPFKILQADHSVCSLAQLPTVHNLRNSCRCKQTMSKAPCLSRLWLTKTGYAEHQLTAVLQHLLILIVMPRDFVCLPLDLLPCHCTWTCYAS